MGGVKVRRESNLATRKKVLHPNPCSPPTLDHMCWVLCGLGRAAQGRPGERPVLEAACGLPGHADCALGTRQNQCV